MLCKTLNQVNICYDFLNVNDRLGRPGRSQAKNAIFAWRAGLSASQPVASFRRYGHARLEILKKAWYDSSMS
jgi:hypothetical protein